MIGDSENVNSLEELKLRSEQAKREMGISDDKDGRIRVVVGMATCGIAAGAQPVYNAIEQEIERRRLKNITVTKTGCIGICQFEPVVEITQQGKEKVTYVKMTPEKAVRVVASHLTNGTILAEYTIGAVMNR